MELEEAKVACGEALCTSIISEARGAAKELILHLEAVETAVGVISGSCHDPHPKLLHDYGEIQDIIAALYKVSAPRGA